jgi:hypothetical protein
VDPRIGEEGVVVVLGVADQPIGSSDGGVHPRADDVDESRQKDAA